MDVPNCTADEVIINGKCRNVSEICHKALRSNTVGETEHFVFCQNIFILAGQLSKLEHLSVGENYLSFLPEEIGSLEVGFLSFIIMTV